MRFPPLFALFWFAVFLLSSKVCFVRANEQAKRLFDDLLLPYNRHLRPSVVQPTEKRRVGLSTVRLKLRLSQIIDVHEIEQIMTVSVWLRQSWMDPRLTWEPKEYAGVSALYVPHEMLWVPDLVLYNNADSHYNITIGTKATIIHTGEVFWEPPAVFKSLCQIDVQWFPFDEQLCQLKFGSWSYPADLLRLTFWEDANGTETEREDGIDLSDYYPSVEWDIMSVKAVRHSHFYSARSSAGGPPANVRQKNFDDIVYNLALRRKPLFYTVNLVFPCVGISFLTILVFYLPSDSGEKIALCISILVALTVFFLLLTEIIPATGTVIPLIGKYLLFTMCMVTLSVLVTVYALNFHFRKPTTHTFSPWIRRLFLRWLPKVLFMRRPLDLSARLLDGRPKVPKRENRTVAQLHQRLDHSLGPIRVLRHSPLEAMCRPPLDERLKRLYRCPKVEKAFENVCFVAELLRRKDRDQKVAQDWKYVASVLDRLFLVLFALCCFCGTAWILLQAPIFYDRRQPIDLQFQPPNAVDV
ncbi:hypothetical protein niasHS_010108 [Heterodera schachtii]|uniref:Uncharacterized protein n=1 Tax=Heterodera schachtii TaxID=97005 RepID=A0ABD2IYQ5_HETSC